MKLSLPTWFGKSRPGGFGRRRAANLRLGRRGERLAERLLLELGLEVLTRNVVGTRGEIDLVARDGVTLCFVEVKTRHRSRRGRPGEAVGRHKRRNLVRTAHQYLRELGHPPLAYRFDIVEVVLTGWRVVDLRYHRRAFTEEDARRQPGQAFPGVGL